MSKFKDSEHLFRVVGVFAIGIIVFVVVRMALVPKSFGEYGHYRGTAISEIAAQRIVFAGHQACEVCHSDVAATKGKGKHAGVNCEACHGGQAAHAADPSSVQPPKLNSAVLCVRCHAVNGAAPKSFPQIVAQEHGPGGVPCDTCHEPHSPLMVPGAKP